ncbi:MAG: hypothetical protein O7E57_03120 [Gammaproteobacteria bacterium]|nr:hypothetical protein [Gammaproteobacteria bacterium]
MTDINIDDFFKDAAKTLVQLYKTFPRRHGVFVDEIYGTEELDEYGMHSERYLACFGTLIWLGEEGFLRYADTIRYDAIDQAVLTARCFTQLCAPATSLEPMDVTDLPTSVRIEKSTNIHGLENAVKERSSARVRSAMLDLMKAMESGSSR